MHWQNLHQSLNHDTHIPPGSLLVVPKYLPAGMLAIYKTVNKQHI